MELPDDEMVRQLTLRDGPLRARSLPHRASGDCRYAEFYPESGCPWCAAVERRRQRELEAGAAV
jgi:hypothetical protein